MPFWNFLETKFDAMPKWVRVSTYLILLGMTVYLYLAPRFVTGQIVARTEAGGFVPYRGVAIQTQVEGHTLKFTTNEDGYWTIPIVDRNPGAVKLQIFHEDDHSWFPVSISAAEIWTEDFRIVVSDKKPFVTLEVVEVTPEQGTWRSSDLRFGQGQFFTRPAHAASLEFTKSQSVEQNPKVQQAFRTQVFSEVRKVVSSVTKVPMVKLKTKTPLDREHGFGYVQRIQVVEALESRYEIKIPDEHWRHLSTIGDLTDYIADRKDIEKAAKLPKSVSGTSNWAKIQQAVGEDAKLKFVPNVTAKEKRYWVVVGSHKNRGNAVQQVRRINRESRVVRAFVGVKVPPNKHFPVMVGSYLPYPDAMKLKSEALMLEAVSDAYLSAGEVR